MELRWHGWKETASMLTQVSSWVGLKTDGFEIWMEIASSSQKMQVGARFGRLGKFGRLGAFVRFALFAVSERLGPFGL